MEMFLDIKLFEVEMFYLEVVLHV